MSSRSAHASTNKKHRQEFLQSMKRLDDDMTNLFTSIHLNRPEDNFSDLTIRCKGVEFKAHRVIVAFRSDFFRACMESGFKEGGEGVVLLNDDDPDAIRMALHEIYTRSPGTVKDHFKHFDHCALNTMIDTWKVADKYKLPELTHQCLGYLTSDDGLAQLKKRAGDAWTADLLCCLSASDGLGTWAHCEEDDRRLRKELKKLLMISKRLSEMSDKEEEILRQDPDLAIEMMKFAMENPDLTPDT